MSRILCWFSCGGPSAVAAKETIARCLDDEVLVVNCDTRASEHIDNYRFCEDVQRWLGQPILHISNPEFKAVDDVFERHRYMSGVKGARCTLELKKKPRFEFAQADDIHVFGFTSGEAKRIRDFRKNNPDLILKFTLADANITRSMCMYRLHQAGIELPLMYRIFDEEDRKKYGQDGFDNNNCPGCVKGSSPWYWSMTRKYFPEVFHRRCEQSRALGVRLVEIKHHKRIFLDELPHQDFKKRRKKENMSCGPECAPQAALKTAKELGLV